MTCIFVFGSNLAGRHGKGAALTALREHRAIYGIGSGRMGSCYAIPTKDRQLRVLPLDQIQRYVDEFIEYARTHEEETYRVTRIGCGLAGYQDYQIAPMFLEAPANCEFDSPWQPFLRPSVTIWRK
jgi:hypothetical protein